MPNQRQERVAGASSACGTIGIAALEARRGKGGIDSRERAMAHREAWEQGCDQIKGQGQGQGLVNALSIERAWGCGNAPLTTVPPPSQAGRKRKGPGLPDQANPWAWRDESSPVKPRLPPAAPATPTRAWLGARPGGNPAQRASAASRTRRRMRRLACSITGKPPTARGPGTGLSLRETDGWAEEQFTTAPPGLVQ